MKIYGANLFLKKTLVIRPGDEIVGCSITIARGVDPGIDIPKETVESENYAVKDNTITLGHRRRPVPGEFVWQG